MYTCTCWIILPLHTRRYIIILLYALSYCTRVRSHTRARRADVQITAAVIPVFISRTLQLVESGGFRGVFFLSLLESSRVQMSRQYSEQLYKRTDWTKTRSFNRFFFLITYSGLITVIYYYKSRCGIYPTYLSLPLPPPVNTPLETIPGGDASKLSRNVRTRQCYWNQSVSYWNPRTGHVRFPSFFRKKPRRRIRCFVFKHWIRDLSPK